MVSLIPCCGFLKTLVLDKPLADPTFDNLLVAIALTAGLLWLSCVSFRAILCILTCVMPAKNLRKYGEWAVVTGATDGIGLGAPACACIRSPVSCA